MLSKCKQLVMLDPDVEAYFSGKQLEIDKNGYVRSCAPRIYIHRWLFPEAPKYLDVDHINRNKLDNRRENLRVVTRSQNAYNHGRCSGVTFWNARKKWRAYTWLNGRQHFHGLFESELEALVAKFLFDSKVVL